MRGEAKKNKIERPFVPGLEQIRDERERRRRKRARAGVILFVMLWSTALLFFILRQQAKNLEQNFANAKLQQKISTLQQEVRERRDKLRDETNLEAIAKRARELGLSPLKESQKRLVPQPEANRMVIHQDTSNAELKDGKAEDFPMSRIYENLQDYFAVLREKYLKDPPEGETQTSANGEAGKPAASAAREPDGGETADTSAAPSEVVSVATVGE